MDVETKNLLEENQKLILENLELTRKNERRIKKMYSSQKRTTLMRTVYWLVIIIISIAAFIYSKPYIEQTMQAYNELRAKIDVTSDVMQNPENLLKESDLFGNLPW